jgi:two-component system cell cycle response regulator DivK
MKLKALVVDDNASNLMLERDLLEVAGFEVFEAVDAAGGIALARDKKPDIIIMDVRLPDMRGSEAAILLHQDKATSDIPIIFVTASVMAQGMEEIKNITNSGFIGKPINTRTFAQEIKEFLKAQAGTREK